MSGDGRGCAVGFYLDGDESVCAQIGDQVDFMAVVAVA